MSEKTQEIDMIYVRVMARRVCRYDQVIKIKKEFWEELKQMEPDEAKGVVDEHLALTSFYEAEIEDDFEISACNKEGQHLVPPDDYLL